MPMPLQDTAPQRAAKGSTVLLDVSEEERKEGRKRGRDEKKKKKQS